MKQNYSITTILLFVGIILLVNVISNQLFFRIDLTENKQYSLSKATKDILTELEDPVTISAYFSNDLPPNISKTKTDFKDLLIEYSNRSKGYVDYEMISPETDEEKQEAIQNGIRPLMINAREKDQLTQQQAFMGAIIRMGEQQEIIPFIQPGVAMEYALSTGIKKLSVLEKPVIGLITGHGEAGLSDLGQVFQSLSVLYNVEEVNLSSVTSIEDKFRAVAMINTQDSIAPIHLSKLDDFLSRGGKLLIAYNGVNGDLSTAQGTAHTTGLETWLQSKSLAIDQSFLIDAQCANVTVQQKQGFFTINTPVKFPYIPMVSTFADHPITEGLEQVIFQFTSPVRFLGDSSKTFTPIVFSSSKAGTLNVPTYFDAQRDWTESDFPLSNLTIGGILEGNIQGNPAAKIVLFSDGDFPISGQQGQAENNINLLVNSIDWLSDDTGLIELRTKSVDSRPIKEEYLGEEASGKRNTIKYLNFGVPIIFVLIYGFLRYQRQRNLRLKRMQEDYS